MSGITNQKVVELTNVLVHCNAMQVTVATIEEDPTLYRHNLKRTLDAFTKECNKNLDRWTESGGDQPEDVKDPMRKNLKHFYQVFEMVMQLTPADIVNVQAHLIDEYYNTPEYAHVMHKVNF